MAVSKTKHATNARWDRKNMTQISASVRNEVKEQFRSVCEQNGTTMNAVLLAAMRSFLAQHGEEPEQTSIDLPSDWTEQKLSVIRTFRSAPWQVDIDDDGENYGAWLSHTDYGTKSFMFGADKSKHSLDEFVGIVFANVADEMDAYKEDHMDE